ncbi:translation factor [Planoprotostelium fungivorum]|uniref:Translation factor n=1 Tax=Planoprotostelium fungivorum TaxID=1890364 RepID=A0A2P6NUT7_9EUKA|nr:translation factor [Planoprotostelium fungivorum]
MRKKQRGINVYNQTYGQQQGEPRGGSNVLHAYRPTGKTHLFMSDIQNLQSFELTKKFVDPFADSEADDFGSKTSNYIHIRINQRTARKTLTTVQGLPKELNYDKVLKALKQKFCCNGTIIEHEELGKVIQLQGDQRKNCQEFLVEEGICKKGNVKIHEAYLKPTSVTPLGLRKGLSERGEAVAWFVHTFQEIYVPFYVRLSDAMVYRIIEQISDVLKWVSDDSLYGRTNTDKVKNASSDRICSRRLSTFFGIKEKPSKPIAEEKPRSHECSPTSEAIEVPALSQSMPVGFSDRASVTSSTSDDSIRKEKNKKGNIYTVSSNIEPPPSRSIQSSSSVSSSTGSISTIDKKKLKELKKEEKKREKEEKERRKKEEKEKKKQEKLASKSNRSTKEEQKPIEPSASTEPQKETTRPSQSIPNVDTKMTNPARHIASPIPLPTPKCQSLSNYGSRFSSVSSYKKELPPNKMGRALPTVTRSSANSPGDRKRDRRGLPRRLASNQGTPQLSNAMKAKPNFLKEFRSPLLVSRAAQTLTEEHYMELMSKHGDPGDSQSVYEDEEQEALTKMVAVYDYSAEYPGDLSIWVGDIVTVLAQFEDGWWLGCRAEDNTMGRVPSNYLEVLPSGISIVRAVADYTSTEEEDLSFESGEIIVITHKREGWWYGEIEAEEGWQEGWVPSNYVEDVDVMTREMYTR